MTIRGAAASIRGAAVGTALAVAWLSGCSSEPDAEPAAATSSQAPVCASADDLRASLTGLGDIQVAQQGTDAALEQAWLTVQADWDDFAAEARDEHSDDVDAVQADFDAVQAGVDAASADPTAVTLGALAADVGNLLTDAGALVDEVSSTC